MEQRQANAIRSAEANRVTGTHPSHPLADYVGQYADSLAGTVRIEQQGETLRLVASSKRAATLEHWHFDTFRTRSDRPWEGSSAVTFQLDASGKVQAMQMGGRTFGRVATGGR